MKSPHDEIRELMTAAGPQIVELMRVALGTGGLARSVVVVKLCPGDVAAVMLCDRASVLADPPEEMSAEQFAALIALEAEEGAIGVLIFSKTCKGVGRVTSEQARRFTLRRTN